jgi:agmatine deiminase
MPAEWEPQQSTWLAWPHDPITWPDRLPIVQDVYVQMIRALARDQRVDLLVDPGEEERAVKQRLAKEGIRNVALHPLYHADSWIRDYGPTFVAKGAAGRRELAFVDWIFNAWGDKYDALLPDDGICKELEPALKMRRFEPGLVMEGGAIDVNGHGCVLTTEQCLLNANRNPHLSKEQIEAALRDNLGVRKVLWLGEGVEGDDTDGHVDDIARFCGSSTVLAAVEEDRASANHKPLRENLERLRSLTDQDGKPLKVLEVPMPGRIEDDEDEPLPASYLNFLVANRVVLAPVFGHAKDARALKVLASAFPDREVVPVPSADLVWGMGTVHCLSQQMPAP